MARKTPQTVRPSFLPALVPVLTYVLTKVRKGELLTDDDHKVLDLLSSALQAAYVDFLRGK